MIRHVVLFRFAPSFTPDLEASWAAGVRGLLGHVDGLLALELERDELGSERSWDYALVADFATPEALQTYATHPLHLPLIEVSGTFSEHIAAVDYTIAGR